MAPALSLGPDGGPSLPGWPRPRGPAHAAGPGLSAPVSRCLWSVFQLHFQGLREFGSWKFVFWGKKARQEALAMGRRWGNSLLHWVHVGNRGAAHMTSRLKTSASLRCGLHASALVLREQPGQRGQVSTAMEPPAQAQSRPNPPTTPGRPHPTEGLASFGDPHLFL